MKKILLVIVFIFIFYAELRSQFYMNIASQYRRYSWPLEPEKEFVQPEVQMNNQFLLQYRTKKNWHFGLGSGFSTMRMIYRPEKKPISPSALQYHNKCIFSHILANVGYEFKVKNNLFLPISFTFDLMRYQAYNVSSVSYGISNVISNSSAPSERIVVNHINLGLVYKLHKAIEIGLLIAAGSRVTSFEPRNELGNRFREFRNIYSAGVQLNFKLQKFK